MGVCPSTPARTIGSASSRRGTEGELTSMASALTPTPRGHVLLLPRDRASAHSLHRNGTVKSPIPSSCSSVQHDEVVSLHLSQSSRNIPDIRPVRQKKAELIPDPSIFHDIDQHALQKTPPEALKSVAALARYLSQPATTDLLAVRAFFRWIANNISYDTEQFFRKVSRPNDAAEVLKRGSSVCSGYAELFQALCSQVEIPCRQVSGWGKGYTYDPSQVFKPGTPTNHAWNLVLVQGQWRHLEATWGTGNCRGEVFHWDFCELWFLTDPEVFVRKHFPYIKEDLTGSAKLQLLERPWTLDEFNQKNDVLTSGLELGLKLTSHDVSSLVIAREVDITMGWEGGLVQGMMAHLKTSGEGEEVQGHTLLRRKGKGFTVKVRPPHAGHFSLELFARPQWESSQFHPVCRYNLECTEAIPDLHPYPGDHHTTYGPSDIAEECGLAPEVQALDVLVSEDGFLDQTFALASPMSALLQLTFAEADLPELDLYAMATFSAGAMHVKVRMPRPGFYKLTVFGRPEDDEESHYDQVLTLLVECRQGLNDCQPFPKSFYTAEKLRCSLLEPLSLYLPANSDVTVRLTSPLLKRMLPSGLQQSGDTWGGTLKTGEAGSKLAVFGSNKEFGTLSGLYEFLIR